jgi:biopolymer transport protein TolR
MSVLFPPRSTMKNSLRHREDAELNLIPLIDILSVMVAFLLVYTTNVEVIQNAKGIEIPQSTAEVLPKQSVVVMITKDELYVQGELVTSIGEIYDSRSPLIEPLRAVLDRPMLVENDAAARDAWLASHEITVVADKSLPYEVVKKVMATCTAAAYGKISLAVIEKEVPIQAAGMNAV